jgi:multisubunit Na+/H+ antiporter MnhC subunit
MMAVNLPFVLYAGAIGLLVIGIAGIVLSRDLFRIILALAIAEAGANLLLILAGYHWGGTAPILGQGKALETMVDPVPQALVLTAIVIGVGIQALALSLALQAYRAYGTLDMRQLRVRLDRDIRRQAGIRPAGSQDAPAGERPTPQVAQSGSHGKVTL